MVLSLRTARRPAGISSFGDRTRAQTVVLYQLLLGVVVLLIAIIGFGGGFTGDEGLFFSGVFAIFVLTGIAIAVPWNRLPLAASAVIPVLDIAAITAMRESSTTSGFGLLWIFPAMWLAGTFGLAGLLFSTVSITAIYLVSSLTPGRSVTFGTLLLPFVIIAVATTSHLTARRAGVQRRLLDNQTRLLGQALARARAQEETLTEVLDAVDFGIIRVSPDGAISVANEAHGRLQRAVGGPDNGGEIPPAYASDGITPLAPGEEPLARALRDETFDGEVVWFGAPGSDRRALTVTTRRVHDDGGTDVGSVIVSQDVTAELVAIRAREDFVASVSHELRTPLTSIIGYIELVLDDDLSPSARRGLEVAERNANRLLVIVADLLAASSSARTAVELSILPERTDVSDIVRASIELNARRAAERGILIDPSRLERAEAWADPSRVRQVLDNLLSNAIKYNVEGGTIEVATTADDADVRITVHDTGTGISEAELSHLFERFFRADAVRKTSTHGSGLGLAIARDIIRSHGGEITVESVPGVGTTFVVRLPTADRGQDASGGDAQ